MVGAAAALGGVVGAEAVVAAQAHNCHPVIPTELSEFHEMVDPAATATFVGPVVPSYACPLTVRWS